MNRLKSLLSNIFNTSTDNSISNMLNKIYNYLSSFINKKYYNTIMLYSITFLVLCYIYYIYKRNKNLENLRRITNNNNNNIPTTTTSITSATSTSLSSELTSSTSVLSKNILRKRYCEANKKPSSLCISTNVIFHPSTYELIDSEILSILKLIANNSILFIISNCKSSDEISKLNEVFCVYGLFDSGLKSHRVLSSTTIPGKIAMMRQLDASLYIDNQIDVVKPLEQFISVAMIGDKYLTLKGSTIFSESVSKLFE